MKKSVLLLLLFISLVSYGQEATVKDLAWESTHLYKQVNESIASGNTKLAMSLFEKIISRYEAEGMTRDIPVNYLGMALSLALNGNYSESIRYHKKALKAHRRYRRTESADEILMNLGFTYQLAGKDRKSKRVLEKI